jgi:hypothetical protein
MGATIPYAAEIRLAWRTFPSSSVVERAAVNR